ncbi:MAG: hypothetical protein ACOX87_09405, partial [Chloroflexota bacterium]
MKKIYFLSLALTLILLAGCAGPATEKQSSTAPTSTAPTSTASTEPADEPTDEEVEVSLVQEPSEYTDDFRPLIDGSVRFEEDTSRQVSVEFPADGTEKTLSLEAGNGLNWVLTIPAGALDHPETITMTDMKSVSSSLGDISGGVVLQ